MKRTITALFVGGAILVGSLGITGTASAQTGLSSNQQSQLTQVLNNVLAQANQICARVPSIPLCRFLPRVNQVDINRLVTQVNSAVIRSGGIAAIESRLAPVKSQLCANKDRVLARVPGAFRTQAATAINRLCSR